MSERIEMVTKTLEDIPGVGPAIAEKLREAGYTELMAIAVASPKELAETCEIGEKKAADIIEGAKLCADIGGFETGEDILERRKAVTKLTTGSQAFDELLAGGLESQSIVEFFGEFGSCKTQVCFQLAVNATLPEERGGFDSDVIIIDSENTFRPERIIQMANYLTRSCSWTRPWSSPRRSSAGSSSWIPSHPTSVPSTSAAERWPRGSRSSTATCTTC